MLVGWRVCLSPPAPPAAPAHGQGGNRLERRARARAGEPPLLLLLLLLLPLLLLSVVVGLGGRETAGEGRAKLFWGVEVGLSKNTRRLLCCDTTAARARCGSVCARS